ncbi:MAG: ornithine carbamoyltransferase [Proteobacteria bacterium]|nr:ornithine carbamoyltransferase [Pseudomonadota bacterium]
MKRDFLAVTDFTAQEVRDTLDAAVELKAKARRGEFPPHLKNAVGALVFHKQSLRTRASFEVGFYQLGGSSVYITGDEIDLGKRESIADVARVMSRYFSFICIRTYKHEDVAQLAQHATVPVVNMLTDLLHPCQLMADMQTVLEHKGTIDNLKVAYLGDGNNMTNSWMKMAQRIPMHLSIGTAPDTLPDADILAQTRAAGLSEVTVHHDPVAAVKDADVVYTDVWASMGAKDQLDQKVAALQSFQVNAALMAHAHKDAIFMHCLPAERGREVTDEVMEGPQSVVFDEAENRLHAQKAILVKLHQSR